MTIEEQGKEYAEAYKYHSEEYWKQCKGIHNPISFADWWDRMKDKLKKQPSNGGPAFPRPTSDTPGQVGMNLRDWFAGMALQAFIANSENAEPTAIAAYAYADAMLKARNKEVE